jgi:hypothetical protein
LSSGERNGSQAIVIWAADAAACTRLGWCGGALSQISSLGTPGRIWPSAATKARQSSWRLRSRMSVASWPVAAFRAPWTTRRALRPERTTSAGAPRLAQTARRGGYSRRVVSSPNQPLPACGHCSGYLLNDRPFFAA